MRRLQVVCLIVGLLLVGSVSRVASQPDPSSAETPEVVFLDFDAGHFDNPTTIDNEWFPMKPGDYWAYDGVTVENGESIPHRIEFTVTDLTKVIEGVTTVVAWIVDYSDGEAVEKEIAFYAQDNDGNVWFFGEHPEEFEGGEFVVAKPWIAGIQEARAGIRMLANPQLDETSYAQGWAPAVDWTDYWQVDQLGLESCVPVDCYEDVMVIAETSLSEPDAFQLKYYARGVGNIRVDFRGADATQEELLLAEFEQLGPEALEAVRAEALALEAHAYEVSQDVYALTQPSEVISSDS